MKNPISSIKEKLTQYIHLRFEQIRLEVIEKLVNVMGYFVFTIIAVFLFFTFGFFLFLGVAEWLSSIFDNYAQGYFSTAGIILVIAVLAVLASKSIVRFFAGKMVWLLTKPKDQKDSSDDEDSESDE